MAATIFINGSQTFGQAAVAASNNITGDLFTTLLLFVIVLFVFCLATGFPMEWTAIVIVPLLITGMAYESTFLPFTGALLAYLSLIYAKYWFTNR